jgi:hypothetical protein
VQMIGDELEDIRILTVYCKTWIFLEFKQFFVYFQGFPFGFR